MKYRIIHGGIPDRSLPVFGWPAYGIPGSWVTTLVAGIVQIATAAAGSVELLTAPAGRVSLADAAAGKVDVNMRGT
ncbi:MAG: hypothetical protein ACE5HE_13470 [Phycisphaerae bacterium]